MMGPIDTNHDSRHFEPPSNRAAARLQRPNLYFYGPIHSPLIG
jgi:hypothetical protein